MTAPKPEADRAEPIPTNLRLLLVLEAVAEKGAPLTPTEANAALGLPKPTIHRLFATLEAEGFLQRETDGRSYSAGRRLRRFSVGVLSAQRIRTARSAILRRLAEEIGETCNIAIPARESMTYLDRVETKWPLRINLPIGSHVPFYCTASGKTYLASLKESHLESYLSAARLEARTPNTVADRAALREEVARIRARGYGEDREEFMEGMVALAVPILDGHGRLLSTLSFHAPAQRLPLTEAVRYLPALRNAADALSALVRDNGEGAP